MAAESAQVSKNKAPKSPTTSSKPASAKAPSRAPPKPATKKSPTTPALAKQPELAPALATKSAPKPKPQPQPQTQAALARKTSPLAASAPRGAPAPTSVKPTSAMPASRSASVAGKVAVPAAVAKAGLGVSVPVAAMASLPQSVQAQPASHAEKKSQAPVAKRVEAAAQQQHQKTTAPEKSPIHEPVPDDQKVDPIARLVDAVAVRLRRREIIGSRNVALATATLAQNVVKTAKFATINDLIRILRGVAETLNRANPKELAAPNIIRRIIKLIKEEYSAAVVAHISQPATPAAPSPGSGSYSPTGYFDAAAPTTGHLRLSDFVAARHVRDQLERSGSSNMIDFSGKSRELEREFERQAAKLKPVLIQAIEEVVNEIETTHEDVARGAKEHIHSSEVILTLGHSRTVETFLKAAFRDRKFTVIVLESAPSFLGQPMAAALANAGIPTLLVPDSSLHAVMPRVTKVIIGAHSVSANGGLIALAGSLACALAARTHAKPVVVTTGQFKFSPSWNLEQGSEALDFQGPGPVVGYDHGVGKGYEGVEVADPHYDYLRPELINLYVTNVGDHPPSYIYRITREAYDDEE